MSVRREARSRVARMPTLSDVPRAFLVGRCVEVWADDEEFAQASAMRRFSLARDWWIETKVSVEDRPSWKLIPAGSPWSVEFLSYRGQAERVGRPLAELVAQRLTEGGCTLRDLPALRGEADDLYASAQFGEGALRRAYKRSRGTG